MPPVVVIPTYNEAENIEPLVFAIRVALPGAVVLVVDDASPDGTADRARAAERGAGIHLHRAACLRAVDEK